MTFYKIQKPIFFKLTASCLIKVKENIPTKTIGIAYMEKSR